MQLPGPASHSYFSQRLRLHYLDWGNPGAPPLILLHGGRDHARNWDWTARALAGEWRIVAPDLRGHGDSEWAADGNYPMLAYIYDLAQLIDQLGLAPVTIVAHSLGGNIALRYAGLFPARVRRLVSIEGLGPSPRMLAERARKPETERLTEWIERKQRYAGRPPRRYPDFAAALARMREENAHLTAEQAEHLTVHAVVRNEDGSYSWKFDPLIHNWWPVDVDQATVEAMWGAITAPTRLFYGADSWASNPAEDGRLAAFTGTAAEVVLFEGAGHWLHHDRFDRFVAELRAFL